MTSSLLSSHASQTLTLQIAAGSCGPGYSEVNPQLWPVGADDQDWVHPAVCVRLAQTTLWKFSNVPTESKKGAGYLVMFTGVRKNAIGQRCRVFVGDAFLQHDTKECPVRDRNPLNQQHTQCFLQATFVPSRPAPVIYADLHKAPVSRILEQTTTTTPKDEEKQAKNKKGDHPQHHFPTDNLQVVHPERHERFLRGFCAGVFGTTVRVSDWFYHVSQETSHGQGAHTTGPAYFSNLAAWYLRWRDISAEQFQTYPERYADVLQFVVGHAAWSQPYCADECVDRETKRFRACESFNSLRWIPGPERSGDCEDAAACLATSFYALCDLQITDQTNPVLRQLVHLARQYTCFIADTIYRGNGSGPRSLMLHGYVKLLPSVHVARLKHSLRLDRIKAPAAPKLADSSLPALFVDSTRRSWSPSFTLTPNMTRTFSRLYRYMRARVSPPEARPLAERFTWATPVELWQFLTGNMYRMDLRYYEPRTRKVYAPQMLKDVPEHQFGLPATYLDGVEWQSGAPFRLTDVTESFVTEGPFADDAKLLDSKAPTAWPPVPGLQVKPERIPAYWPFESSLSACVPVFLRLQDLPDVLAAVPRSLVADDDTAGTENETDAQMAARGVNASSREQKEHAKVALWLESVCRETVRVKFTERLYAHGDEVGHIVCYVQAEGGGGSDKAGRSNVDEGDIIVEL